MDENFPVRLHRRLRDAGHQVEHLITSGQRGLPDAAIRERLRQEADLVFLTQDTEFEELAAGVAGTVVISRVPQALPLGDRLEVWQSALERFLIERPPGRLFELVPPGEMVPLEVRG